MAGDWIKMRGELYTHPKFLSLCNELVHGPDARGLFVYTCGEDALGIGVMPPSNEPVTSRALRLVTERALRDVVMSSLLRVWCAVNSHCKVSGCDALMCPMIVQDLDDIAGVDGFGDAMGAVGWVREGGDNSLLFSNFCEYNEPACLRVPAKTNAQRQREFRDRKAAQTPVTRSNESNDREEKRREEKNKTPLPPVGGGAKAKTKAAEHPHFAGFWSAFPKKTARPKASESFTRLNPDEGLSALILAAVEQQSKSDDWRREGGRYIPHPATWLNNRRWEDQPPEVKPDPITPPSSRYAVYDEVIPTPEADVFREPLSSLAAKKPTPAKGPEVLSDW